MLSASTIEYPFWSLGVGLDPSSATALRAANGAPPSTSAEPTAPIHSPQVRNCSADCSGVKSCIGVAGPRYRYRNLLTDRSSRKRRAQRAPTPRSQGGLGNRQQP